MISLLVSTLISTVPVDFDENRLCSYIVGIPYASDNFTDAEWERFELCKHYIQIDNETEISRISQKTREKQQIT